MILCCIVVLVQFVFTLSPVKRTKCKQLTCVAEALRGTFTFCQTTMERHQRIAIALIAAIFMIWCCNQIRPAKYEHILRRVCIDETYSHLVASQFTGNCTSLLHTLQLSNWCHLVVTLITTSQYISLFFFKVFLYNLNLNHLFSK